MQCGMDGLTIGSSGGPSGRSCGGGLRAAARVAFAAVILAALVAAPRSAAASQAYGSINNFDCVNDTGSVCHGFEIEIDDAHSKDITYTYDYNHYGVPKITEDNSIPAHPKVYVRYLSGKNPDGTWKAYTAIPAGPIPPTAGHQFTNPSVNFGGEHFGVGFYGTPTAVKYSWLKDDGAGNLVFAGAVNISTPAFTYNVPVGAPANVQAVIVPPPPPAPPVFQFGDASWVKEIKTTTHNPNKVHIEDLVGDDPGKPQPWANGENPEVEMEWKLLQTEFANAGNPKGRLEGAPEDLPGGDEVITRRYEHYKYTGPIDAETGEAMADAVAADGKHGVGKVTYADHFDLLTGEWVLIEVDLSTIVVVGDFIGAQMAGFDPAPALGLIDHIQDGEVGTAYADRTVVIAGATPFVADIKPGAGALPDGLTLDPLKGVLTGTPNKAGVFTFTVEASDLGGAAVSKTYTVTVSATTGTVSTSAAPAVGGKTSGDGVYSLGDPATVSATPNPGYVFVNWTEGAAVVSVLPSYTFTVDGDHALVANFEQTAVDVSTQVQVTRGGLRLNRATGRYVQQITVKNMTGSTITGPVSVVLDNLSVNATLANKTGVTVATVPSGNPYLTVTGGSLGAGASVTANLEFANPSNKNITYATRVLAGPGTR